MSKNDSDDKNNDKPSFETLFDSVTRMKQDRVAPYRRKITPIPEQHIADENRVMEELLEVSDEASSYASGDELKYLRDGYQPKLLRKLRRGDYSMQDELDLHGMISSEAKLAVHQFVNECARNDVRAVRIIHGKGLHSPDKRPVIKNLILGWLRKNKHVLAVCSTPGNDGSTGAVYVLLN